LVRKKTRFGGRKKMGCGPMKAGSNEKERWGVVVATEQMENKLNCAKKAVGRI